MRWDYYRRMALNYLREPERIRTEYQSWQRRRQAARAVLPPLSDVPAAELPLVVSLTSYGTRISRVHLAIRSIMDQTLRPNRVELWLGTDSDAIALPRELCALTELGLTIHRDVEDIKGHKKYYFSMREAKDKLLVTIDDDLVYARDTLETLVAAHRALPEAVVARRCHRIRLEGDALAPYDTWDMNYAEAPLVASRALLATTGAGTLYPPNTFDAITQDSHVARELALTADDLWVKIRELVAGIDVAWAPNALPLPYGMPASQQDGLFFENLHNGGNDAILARLMEHYGICARDFADEV